MRTFKFFTIPLLTVIFFFGGLSLLSAQIPGIPYQAYIQNKDAGFIPGEQYHDIPMAMADILLEFDIVNSKGVVEYTERIKARTDKFGLVNTVIGVGSGTVTYADFDNIDWDGLKKTMNIRIDMTGTGTKFEPHGEIDLVNIPSKTFTGMTTGKGAPTASFPANPTAGHVYVDENTGLMYAFDGTNWVKQFGVVDGLTTGPGAPTPTNPTNPQAGDVYIDESTGNVYTYDGTTWVNQTIGTVTTLADNNDGTYTYTSEDGTTTAFAVTQSGTGDPTTAGVTGAAGDVYVDESTGNIYTHDGTGWEVQTGIVSKGTGDPITTGVTGEAGDVYIDESTGNVYTYDGTTWINQTIGTVTTLADNNDGTYTYTSEDGTTTAFAVTQSGTGDPTTAGVTGAAGDVYVDESTGDIYTHDGTGWEVQTGIVSKGTGDPITTGVTGEAGDVYIDESTGNVYTYDGTTWVKQTVADATTTTKGIIQLAGDFTGTADAPKVSGIQGTPVSATAPTANQILVFDAATGAWTPAAAPATGTDDQNIIVGAGTATTTEISIEGAADATALTIAAASNITLTEDTATKTITFEVDESNLADIAPTSIEPGADGQVLTTTGTGAAATVGWKPAASGADHLGNHIATQDIQLGTFGITDTDGNTQIQVEKTANDDTIRFDTMGTERMTIDQAGLVSYVGAGSTTTSDQNAAATYTTIGSTSGATLALNNIVLGTTSLANPLAERTFTLPFTNTNTKGIVEATGATALAGTNIKSSYWIYLYDNPYMKVVRADFQLSGTDLQVRYADGRYKQNLTAIPAGSRNGAYFETAANWDSTAGAYQIATVNIASTATAAATNASIDTATGNAYFKGSISDSNNNPGTPGQILSSTASGTAWINAPTAGTPVSDATTTTNGIVRLAGDLGGTSTAAAAPIVGGIQGIPVMSGTPGDGQILTYSQTNMQWEAAAPGTGADNMGNHQATQDIIMGTHGIQDGASTPTTGATGQILSSTGTGTLWVYPAGTSVEKTADYTIVDEGTVYVKPSTPVTITLPDPTGKDGKRVTVKRADDATATLNTLTVTTTVGDIDGVSNVSLNMGFQAFTFEAYNNAWRIVNRF